MRGSAATARTIALLTFATLTAGWISVAVSAPLHRGRTSRGVAPAEDQVARFPGCLRSIPIRPARPAGEQAVFRSTPYPPPRQGDDRRRRVVGATLHQ